jgi:hypothetical protein
LLAVAGQTFADGRVEVDRFGTPQICSQGVDETLMQAADNRHEF